MISPRRGGRIGSAVLLVTALAGVLVGVVAVILESGSVAWGWGLMALSSGCIALAMVVSFHWPRDRRPLDPAPGVVRVRAPVVLVVALVASYAALFSATAVWGFVAVTDFSRLDPAGPLVVLMLGMVGSLPELGRLLTGRLHRWTLVLDDEGITYRGYRSLVHEPWSAVRGAAVVWERRREGVLVDLQASRPDLLVPWPAFLVHPDVLAAAISERARTSGRW